MDVREKLEVIAHLGDHISYKEDIGICYDSDLAKVIEDAYMALKNGVTVQEWISVKDRLPESGKDAVMIALRWGEVDIGWCEEGRWGSEFVNEYDDGEVTHWMPLPQPPKGE